MENTKIVLKLEDQQLILDVEGTETKYDLQEQAADFYELSLTPDEILTLGKNLVKGIKCQGCGRKGAMRRDGDIWLCTFCAACEAISRGEE